MLKRRPVSWKLFEAIFVTMALVSFMSCSATGNKNCTETTDVFLQADFYSASLNAPCGLTIGSVIGIGSDSIWMKNTDCSSMSLPLHPNDSLTAFAVSFMMTDSSYVADTISFRHTNQPFVLSVECGGIVMHELEAANNTKHCLDSISILTPHVDNVLTTNVIIWVP